LFWIFAIAITSVACAALYYASLGRPVNAAATAGDDATTAHFRLQLREIEADTAAGRLGEAEGVAAKSELAREVIRLERPAGPASPSGRNLPGIFAAAALTTALLAFGAYSFLGNPGLPSLPLAGRAPPAAELDLDDAVARIEAQLAKTPDDLRGWTVIAPVYMQLQRFADAANAFRRIIALDGATADRETDLGEALMLGQGGSVAGEPLALFASAAARDPRHVRSRFYIAAESTRAGQYEQAIGQWTDLLALGTGSEPWVETARAGLESARSGLNGEPDIPADDAAIRGMVDGLANRLYSGGGSIEDWTRLVRSRLVLGDTAAAQSDYDKARVAFPDPAGRTELDVLAADNGLVMQKAAN